MDFERLEYAMSFPMPTSGRLIDELACIRHRGGWLMPKSDARIGVSRRVRKSQRRRTNTFRQDPYEYELAIRFRWRHRPHRSIFWSVSSVVDKIYVNPLLVTYAEEHSADWSS